MRKLLFLLFLVLTRSVFYGQIPEKPNFNNYVYDYSNALTIEQNENLKHLLYQFDSITSNQIVIVLVDNLEGIPIENYSIELAEKWGIGMDGKDNGILICASIKDKKIRIEVGYGLEHVITDFWSSRHLREDVNPFFKAKSYYSGLYTLIKNMCQTIDTDITFPAIDEQIANQKSPLNRTPKKPSPFTYIIDDANIMNSGDREQLEMHLKKLHEKYSIPIHFYLYNEETSDNIIDKAYDIRKEWDFPLTISTDENSNKYDGILVVHNVKNQLSSCIVGYTYNDGLYSQNIYQIIDSNMTKSSLPLIDRVNQTSRVLAETYHSEYLDYWLTVGGTLLGIILFIIFAIKFGGNGKSSARTFSSHRWTDSNNSSSSSSTSSNSGSFGGGSFGGGGATGSW